MLGVHAQSRGYERDLQASPAQSLEASWKASEERWIIEPQHQATRFGRPTPYGLERNVHSERANPMRSHADDHIVIG